YEIRALLLAFDTRSRRIHPARARGCGRRLRRCRAPAEGHAGDGLSDEKEPRLCAALPARRHPGDRADGADPALPRPAPRARAQIGGPAAMAAPAATHDQRLAGRGARHAPPGGQRPLLRGPEAGIATPRRGLSHEPAAEVPRLLRARGAIEDHHVRRSVALPDDPRAALRVSTLDAV